MNITILALKILMASLFVFAGVMHLVKPSFFKYFTPPFLPLKTTNYIVGIMEIVVGLGLLYVNTIKLSALSIALLLIIFLPIHIWDLTKKNPAIGSKTIAILRIPLQFLLIYLSYLIYIHS